MSQPAVKLEIAYSPAEKQKKIEDKINETHTEELIIGLCGPIGTDIHYVADEIKAVITEKFDYDVEVIKLSSFIKRYKGFKSTKSRFTHQNELISLGNLQKSIIKLVDF